VLILIGFDRLSEVTTDKIVEYVCSLQK
jgi:hypothetical protein